MASIEQQGFAVRQGVEVSQCMSHCTIVLCEVERLYSIVLCEVERLYLSFQGLSWSFLRVEYSLL